MNILYHKHSRKFTALEREQINDSYQHYGIALRKNTRGEFVWAQDGSYGCGDMSCCDSSMFDFRDIDRIDWKPLNAQFFEELKLFDCKLDEYDDEEEKQFLALIQEAAQVMGIVLNEQ